MTTARLRTAGSEALMARARQLFPGGVSSPVRSFSAVGGTPRVIRRALGSRLWDVDGNELIDYVGSWGAAILGHAHPSVVAAVQVAAERGTSYGTPTPGEVELADLIVAAMPAVERLRFVSSGTEAAMSAIRLARAATRRERIVKMRGGYHGHADALLVQPGSGAAGMPASAGVTTGAARDTLVAPYNDPQAVERLLAAGDVAAVIVEPVAANMGVVPPAAGYLEGLRAATERHGTLLIFDEVITGFRVAPGGAQQRYAVTPDLTVLGKIIGGGLPVGAYGGRADLMALVAPEGPVYQAGTLSGNPLAMAAGAATLRLLVPGTYERLEDAGRRLADGLRQAAEEAGAAVRIGRVGSLLTPYVDDFSRFFHAMLARGVMLPPSQHEAWFVSAAHTDDDLDATVAAARAAFATLMEDR
ncbi:MAG TPA: glutamate-1-semialdehyde 2,1-aminomutase [candidate division Zixibacteria bacterium]|nr:glutamate-1-semialdehyde 2,1-aminomutase [candidate division Zixibacteria bacterium]